MEDSISFSRLIVSLSAIQKNTAGIISHLPCGAKLIPVLKADAYGLGLVPVAKALCSSDRIAGFAVAYIEEGLQLRNSGVSLPIFILGPALPFQYKPAILSDLSLTVGSLSDLSLMSRAAEALGKKVSVQIKFDTGLHRFGISPDEINPLISALNSCSPFCSLKGTYSHFADPFDADRCKAQFQSYMALSDALESHGFSIPLRHICDSAASELYPEYALDAIRVGRGLMWDNPVRPNGNILEAATLQTVVTGIWHRKAGEIIGYGDGLTLLKDTRIASIGIGYGDGIDLNAVRQHLPVLLHGQACSLLYSFMDHTLIDIGDLPCAPGDMITFFGYDESGIFLSAQKQAAACGANEACAFTTALLPRVKRVYTF